VRWSSFIFSTRTARRKYQTRCWHVLLRSIVIIDQNSKPHKCMRCSKPTDAGSYAFLAFPSSLGPASYKSLRNACRSQITQNTNSVLQKKAVEDPCAFSETGRQRVHVRSFALLSSIDLAPDNSKLDHHDVVCILAALKPSNPTKTNKLQLPCASPKPEPKAIMNSIRSSSSSVPRIYDLPTAAHSSTSFHHTLCDLIIKKDDSEV